MMFITEIQDKVFRIVMERLGKDKVQASDLLDEDLGADSLDRLDLANAVSEAFDIDDPSLASAQTVKDLIDGVRKAIS
jgi:acyl carrier protein